MKSIIKEDSAIKNQVYHLYSLPVQLVEATIQAAEDKAKMSLRRQILLGICSGMFIACGAAASSVAVHNIANVGLARLVAGVIFPIGMMMIIFIGGELFTGNCLMIMGCLHKKITALDMVKVLLIVYFSNLMGTIIIALLVNCSGQFNYSDGLLGAYAIKVAMGKISLSFGEAFTSGILCNVLVCGAVLMSSAARDISGKVWAIFFPIMVFIVSGYEHCVANMYYIPAAIFAKSNPLYATQALTAYGYNAADLETLNWGNFLFKNILPVTLGNMVGGIVLVGMILYYIHEQNIKADEKARGLR